MAFFRSLASGLVTGTKAAAKGAAWFTEKLNLKTDPKLKGDDLSKMRDEKLISKRGSTVRSVASSVTGIIANAALGVACPIFIAPAVISTIQLGVSVTNYRRVHKEVKKRKKTRPDFKARLRKRDVVVDVVIGGTVKAAFTALGAGIVGFDNVVDNFAELAHKAGEHVIAQHAADAVSNNAVNESMEQVLQHSHNTAAAFQIDHPHIAKIDSGVHKAVGGVGDEIAEGMRHLTDMQIDQTTSWEGLGALITDGAHRAKAFAQMALVGVFGEMMQFINHAGEIGIDEQLVRRDKKTQIEKAKDHLEKSQSLNGYLRGTQLERRAKQDVQVLNALKTDPNFQRRRTVESAESS